MRLIWFMALFFLSVKANAQVDQKFYAANHPFIQYTGRVDFSNPLLPRFWQPGVYISLHFSGRSCEVILNDEVLWGKNHNYLEMVLDGKAIRLQTENKTDTIEVSSDSDNEVHELIICKNTEANIGYLEFVGIRCQELIKPKDKPARKIECIGNSITCGASSDPSAIPCHAGQWHDQHNAYMSYGAVTARTLQAQYHLSSVSGIGLMHSCCDLNIVMPEVFDKTSMRNNTVPWDFNRYIPDVVTVCLGQNDGIQNMDQFCSNYILFLNRIRNYYPDATIICLTSPMADEALRKFMKTALDRVVQNFKNKGDLKICSFVFNKQYIGGCDSHPDLKEHAEIARLLSAFIKQKMNW